MWLVESTKCDWVRKCDWLWVRFPLAEIKYLFKLMFSFLRSGLEAKAQLWVLPLNTQCLQNSAESGNKCFNTKFPLTMLNHNSPSINSDTSYYSFFLTKLSSSSLSAPFWICKAFKSIFFHCNIYKKRYSPHYINEPTLLQSRIQCLPLRSNYE